MNNVSILFSWHKSSEEFIKRDNFLPRKKLLTSETNGELKRIFNSYQHYSKKCVIDGFLSLHCLKCVPIKSTCEREIFRLFYVTKCKGFNSFKLKKNHKAESF